MSESEDVREDVERMSAYALAGMADCGTPDARDSVGAVLLEMVRDSALDQFDTGRDASDACAEIADGAPSIYTHLRWRQFVDLAAYREDLSEIGQPDDLTEAAAVALYLICDRLALALWDMLAEAAQADADEEE